MGIIDSQHLFIEIGEFLTVLDESVTVARHYREVNIKAGTRPTAGSSTTATYPPACVAGLGEL